MSLWFLLLCLFVCSRRCTGPIGVLVVWCWSGSPCSKSVQTQPLRSADNAAPPREGMSVTEAEHENVICHFSSVLQPWLQAPPRNRASTTQMFSLRWLLGILPLSNCLQSLENQGLMCSQKLAQCPAGYLCNIALPREHVNKYICLFFFFSDNFFCLFFPFWKRNEFCPCLQASASKRTFWKWVDRSCTNIKIHSITFLLSIKVKNLYLNLARFVHHCYWPLSKFALTSAFTCPESLKITITVLCFMHVSCLICLYL